VLDQRAVGLRRGPHVEVAGSVRAQRPQAEQSAGHDERDRVERPPAGAHAAQCQPREGAEQRELRSDEQRAGPFACGA
jgi:hypothetical protein